MRSSTIVAGLAGSLLALAGSATAATEGGTLDGIVELVPGGFPILVRAQAGYEVVGAERGLSLVGIGSARDLQPGDRVRVRWARTVGGVKLAGSMEAAPAVRTDPDLH